MTPELLAIRQAIENNITTNHNGEITGAILNPILVGMITALVDSIGDIEALDTIDKENTVRAINELNGLIQDLEPIQKFTGTEDPNYSPPAGATLGDLYFQMNGGIVVDVWQFIEIRWVSLDTSSFVRKTGENLVSTDFSLKNKVGSMESSVNLNGFEFMVASKESDEGWNASLRYNAEEGLLISFGDGSRYIRFHAEGVQGDSFRLLYPDTQGNQRFIPVSVNGEFADEFGNIEIEATDTNALKKNESNTVTGDFEITNGESTLRANGDYFIINAGDIDYEFVDDGMYIISGSRSLELRPIGISGHTGNGWSFTKPITDVERSRVYLPQTGDTERRLAISVNNEFADENGNIELDYISESEKGQPLGVATLDADGHIPTDQLPTKAMTIEGDWDASTNTPFLEDGVGNDGMVYVCQVPGTVDFGSGEYEFKVGDWAVYGANGKWFRNRNSNEVTSVNGMRGDVVLDAGDVGALASDDSRIANWDSAYAFSNGLGVPYTGANKPIDFGNQRFTHNGTLLKGIFIAESRPLYSSSIPAGSAFFINISNLSAGGKAFSVVVEAVGFRGDRLDKIFNVSINSSGVLTVRSQGYTYCAGALNDFTIGSLEVVSSTEVRIPILPNGNNREVVAKVTVQSALGSVSSAQFAGSVASTSLTPTTPVSMFALASETAKIKTFPTHAITLNGAFNEELFDVCPIFDRNFVSWDLTWQDGNEYLSLKQEYFTKTDTPLRLTTVGGCLAITGDCFIQIDVPAGANLVLNYA